MAQAILVKLDWAAAPVMMTFAAARIPAKPMRCAPCAETRDELWTPDKESF
jgi:hypothetical protein